MIDSVDSRDLSGKESTEGSQELVRPIINQYFPDSDFILQVAGIVGKTTDQLDEEERGWAISKETQYKRNKKN